MMGEYHVKARGFARTYWPALAAAAVALTAIVAGLVAMPSDQEAADALERSYLPYKAIPYRLRDAEDRPADPETVMPLVDAYIRNGQQSQALAVLDAYLQGNPDDLRAFYRAATLADWEGLPDQAAQYRFEIVRLDPTGKDAKAGEIERTFESLGGYLVWKKRISEAADVYLDLLRLNNEDADVAMRTGDVLLWAGRFDEAADVFEKALAANPQRLDAYLRLGRVYDWVGKDAEGISAYERAVEADPNLLTAWVELSRLYQATNQPEKAAEAFQQIRRLQ